MKFCEKQLHPNKGAWAAENHKNKQQIVVNKFITSPPTKQIWIHLKNLKCSIMTPWILTYGCLSTMFFCKSKSFSDEMFVSSFA